MKKGLLKFIVIIGIIVLLNMYSFVCASSYDFTVNPEEKIVYVGETVTVDLTVSNIDAGTEGINVVETKLEYDSNYIENIEFIDENQWAHAYNSTDGRLLWHKMVNGVTETELIGKLNIKIKDNLEDVDTEIYLRNVTSNDGYSLMNDGDKVIRLHIKKKVMPTTVPTATATPTTAPTTAPTAVPTAPSETPTAVPTATPTAVPTELPTAVPTATTTPKIEPTATPKVVPAQNIRTGDIMPIIAISIIVLVIVGNVIYFVVRKKNKENK